MVKRETGTTSRVLTRRRALLGSLGTIGVMGSLGGVNPIESVSRVSAQQSNELVVTKDGAESGRAVFTMTVDGTLSPASDFEGVVKCDRALDWIGPDSGTDTIEYTGSISSFLLDGPARVLVNGEEVDPTKLPTSQTTSSGDSGSTDERVFEVTKEGTEYGLGAFVVRVSGTLEPGDSFEGVIEDSIAIDRVGPSGGTDDLRVVGEIEEFALAGNANAFVDGSRLRPDDIACLTTEDTLDRVRPGAELTIEPQTTVLFEVTPAEGIDVFSDIDWWVDPNPDPDQTGDVYPKTTDDDEFTSLYAGTTGNSVLMEHFKETGTYTVEAVAPGGAAVQWTVHVDDSGQQAPAIESLTTAPEENTINHGEPTEVTVTVSDPDGDLVHVVWFIAVCSDIDEITAVSGDRDTATFETVVTNDCLPFPWVIDETGLLTISTGELYDEIEINDPVERSVIWASDPTDAGDRFDVVLFVRADGQMTHTEQVSLLSDDYSTALDTTSIEVEPGEWTTARLGYKVGDDFTRPDHIPVQIDTEHERVTTRLPIDHVG